MNGEPLSAETNLFLMCSSIFVLPLLYCAVSWLSGNRNTPAGGGEHGDKIIRSDVPGHPEYATQRAAEIVNQRETGGVKYWGGDERTVYVNSDPEHSDWHSQQRHIDYMTENGRAARNGVKVHKVSAAERDARSAMRQRGTTWINPPAEGFDPETGLIDEGKGIRTERTPGPGLGGLLQVIALIASILFAGGAFFALLYYANEILFPVLGW